MRARIAPVLILSLLATAGNLKSASADPLPAPTEELRDFEGRGILQLDLPPATRADGKTGDSGLSLVIPIRQAYVRPDRMLLILDLFNVRQIFLAQAATERSFNPTTGYILEVNYRNFDPTSGNPMTAAQLSMATYARLLRELTAGKLLPDEDLDRLLEKNRARIAELAVLRKPLQGSRTPEDIQKNNVLANEHARLREDVEQIPYRKVHPCYVVEFENRHLLQHLLARGFVEERGTEILARGKTTFWVTRAEGLPIKMETTDNSGHVAIYFSFTSLRINGGLRPGDLVLTAPAGTRQFAATANLKDRGWQDRLSRELGDLIDRAEQERAARSQPAPAGKQPKKKK